MNHTFSIKRFGMLFAKHTIENLKAYLMSLFVFLGILTVTIAIANYHSPIPHQMEPYMIFLVAAGTIFTSNIFVNLGDKRKSIATLTLPASTLEKFLVSWVYSFVIFQLLYTGLYYLLMLAILKLYTWPQEVELMSIFSKKVYYIFVVYAFLHAVVFYGAIVFKKMHFIKTAFVLFITGGIISILNNQAVQVMIGKKISGNPPFLGASFKDGTGYYNVDLPYDYLNWMVALFLTLAVIIWVAAYYRLKEKQV